MARVTPSYEDNKGELHRSPENATIADLATILGRMGDDGGMAAGVARLILEKRREIEAAFADYDEMLRQCPPKAAPVKAVGDV